MSEPSTPPPMSPIEQIFERVIWNSRFMILIPVIMSILAAFGVVIVTTVDGITLFGMAFSYLDPGMATDVRDHLRLDVLSRTVTVIDGYLLSAIMLIFALGLYELFVSKVNIAERSGFAARLLHIESIDDLKNRLARIVVLILIVKLFQLALGLKYESPQDLLFLAISVLLVGGALFLSNLGHH